MLCFRKLPVSKKNMHKRGRGLKVDCRKIFCLRVPKNLVGENICAVFQKISGSEKDYGLERGISRSSVETFFDSECRKFPGGKVLFCVSEIFQ